MTARAWRRITGGWPVWCFLLLAVSPARASVATHARAGSFDRFMDGVNLLSPEFTVTAGKRIAGLLETENLNAVQRRMLDHLLRQLLERAAESRKSELAQLRFHLETFRPRAQLRNSPGQKTRTPAVRLPRAAPERSANFRGQRSARFLK